jgi:hypothetical protein
MPDISLRYKFTFEDYLNAQQLYRKRGLWPRMSSFFANWLCPFVGLCFFGIAFLQWREYATGSVLFSIYVGAIFVGCRFYLRWKSRRSYQRARTGSGDYNLSFRESNFSAEESDYEKTEYSWNVVKSWREDANVMLVYIALALFIAIPKRTISEQQLSDLRALLARKVTRST